MARPRARLAASIAVAAALLARSPAPRAFELREYEIKAGFLFNFFHFVEWPPDAFADSTDPLRLEVVGHDPFDGALERLVEGRLVNGRRVVVFFSADMRRGPRGHLVFVSDSEVKRVASIIATLRRSPALTVSSIDGFAERGGVIGFVQAGESVRFVINRAAAGESRLRISSKLLSLARLAQTDGALQRCGSGTGNPAPLQSC